MLDLFAVPNEVKDLTLVRSDIPQKLAVKNVNWMQLDQTRVGEEGKVHEARVYLDR